LSLLLNDHFSLARVVGGLLGFLGFVVGLMWFRMISLLRRNGVMLPLLVGLMMLRRREIHVRFVLPLALVSSAMADET
jgi:hypothetical protein